MYELTFEVNGKKITKSAKTEKEVKRLVYVYVNGSQHEKDALVSDIVSKKEADKLNDLIKPKNKKEDVSNL